MKKLVWFVYSFVFAAMATCGAIHPYAEPACGYHGHVCKTTGMCCAEAEDCAGETVGCPASNGPWCCYKGGYTGAQWSAR